MENGPDSARLSSEEVRRLTDQVAALARAGLPLPPGLRALAAEMPRGRLRRSVDRLASSLESGETLDKAISSQRGRLPAFLGGLVSAGLRTGKLGEVLGRYAGYSAIGVDLRRSLLLRLINPAIAILVATIVLCWVCAFSLKMFAALFADYGVPLPLLTVAMITLSDLMESVKVPAAREWLTLGGILIVAILGVPRIFGVGMLSGLPLIGYVWRLTSLADFSHLLALLLECDVPLVEALPMAGAAVDHSGIAAQARSTARMVAEGSPLAGALIRCRLYPRGIGAILDWADRNRGLPEALHMAGEMFEVRARSQANLVATMISIMGIVAIILGITLTVVSVLLPIITLLVRLTG
jgi:general secretion pathway protein F